jgi:hypothetical protein
VPTRWARRRRAFAHPTHRRSCESRNPYAAASQFGTLADGFCSNRRRWLWVPAFAGTTNGALPVRHCERKRSNPYSNEHAPVDCFVALLLANDDQPHHRIPAARIAPELLPPTPALTTEGAGNAGRWMRPQPRVQNKKSTRASHHGHTGNARHSPRNGFNGVLRALPGESGLFVTVACGNEFRKLDAGVEASGPHDFAVRLLRRSSAAPKRPPHPAPTSVTIAKRPSEGRDGASL